MEVKVKFRLILISLTILLSTLFTGSVSAGTCEVKEQDPRVDKAWSYIESGQLQLADSIAQTLMKEGKLDGYLIEVRILFERGETSQALDLLLRAKKLFPSEPRVYLNLGRLYFISAMNATSNRDGLIETARLYFSKALELDSACMPAVIELARLCYAIDDTGGFEEWLSYAENLNPEHPKVIELKAMKLADDGKYAALRDYLESHAEVVRSNVQLKKLLLKAYIETQESESARKLLQELIAQTPKDYELYNMLGKLYGRAQAVQLEDYIISNSGLHGKDLELALAYFWEGIGDVDMALAHYDKAIELDPDDPDLYEAVGTYLISNSRFQEAIPYLDKLVKLQPDDYKPYFLLGTAYRHAGYPKQAIGYLEKAKALNPKYPHTYVELGNAYWDIAFKLFEDYRQEGFVWFDKGVEVAKEAIQNVDDETYKARFQRAVEHAGKIRKKIQQELMEHNYRTRVQM